MSTSGQIDTLSVKVVRTLTSHTGTDRRDGDKALTIRGYNRLVAALSGEYSWNDTIWVVYTLTLQAVSQNEKYGGKQAGRHATMYPRGAAGCLIDGRSSMARLSGCCAELADEVVGRFFREPLLCKSVTAFVEDFWETNIWQSTVVGGPTLLLPGATLDSKERQCSDGPFPRGVCMCG